MGLAAQATKSTSSMTVWMNQPLKDKMSRNYKTRNKLHAQPHNSLAGSGTE